MTWYYWIWAIVGAIIFFAFFGMVIMASISNWVSGERLWAISAFVVLTPCVVVFAAAWPAWFPITFVIDIVKMTKDRKA